MNSTDIVLIALAALIIISDIVLFAIFGISGTISYEILRLSKKYPVIPFGFGLLMGHFFT